MRFGIIQRYVLGEVLRAFALAQTTITGIIVLFMVMAEATKVGLPLDVIVQLVPYFLPATLPYTVPVALLFAVSVVYGRIAADSEVIALKSCGQGAWSIIWPVVFLATMLSVGLVFLGRDVIPSANRRAAVMLFSDLEDTFYMFLKHDHQFNNPKWPFLILVRDVQDKELIDATFKKRNASGGYDMIVRADRARVEFDIEERVVRVHVRDARMFSSQGEPHEGEIPSDAFSFPIPESFTNFEPPRKVQSLTAVEIAEKQAELRMLMETEVEIQAGMAGLWIASGWMGQPCMAPKGVDWGSIRDTLFNQQYWEREYQELETEKQARIALAAGVVGFVLLGAPVGIRGAKRDFLSSFIFSFLPIIIGYYPAILLGINAGKEGLLDPTLAVWIGNFGLIAAAGFVLPPIIRH